MLAGASGLDLIKRVHRYHPDLPVLVVSMHDEALYARRARAAGARGYVMKRGTEGDILEAARAVRQGHPYFNDLASDLPDSDGQTGDAVQHLTDREFEVFLLIGQGFTPRHIAAQLALSVSTVEVYRERLKEKLRLESSPHLLRYAVRWCKDQHDG